MNVFNRFDRIVCIHYAPQKERYDSLVKEFERVGIMGVSKHRLSFEMSSPSEYGDAVYEAMRSNGYDVRSKTQFDVSSKHNREIVNSLRSGCRSLLIMENDVRFLKDAEKAREIVSSFHRSKADIMLFDRFLWTDKAEERDGLMWFKDGVRGASCYALTRNGMERMATAFGRRLKELKTMTVSDETYDFVTCPKAYTKECACIQKEFPDANNFTQYKTRNYDVYRKNGVDISLYNV